MGMHVKALDSPRANAYGIALMGLHYLVEAPSLPEEEYLDLDKWYPEELKEKDITFTQLDIEDQILVQSVLEKMRNALFPQLFKGAQDECNTVIACLGAKLVKSKS